MCTLGFRGMGYSPSFVKNFKELKSQITENPEAVIQLQSKTDHICGPCPHNMGQGVCSKQKKIEVLDDRHLKALDLHNGVILKWEDALTRIKSHMTLEKFHDACEGCEWKSYGVCEEALKELNSSKNEQSI